MFLTCLRSWPVFICVHRALFAYDGVTNKLKLADSGGEAAYCMRLRNKKKVCSLCPKFPLLSVIFLSAGGVAELAGKFHLCKPQYGLCKIGSGEMGGPRIAMIIWVSEQLMGLGSFVWTSYFTSANNEHRKQTVSHSKPKVQGWVKTKKKVWKTQ